MEFLLSHWHCILPIVGIGIALFFMREKPNDKKEKQNNAAVIPPQNSGD